AVVDRPLLYRDAAERVRAARAESDRIGRWEGHAADAVLGVCKAGHGDQTQAPDDQGDPVAGAEEDSVQHGGSRNGGLALASASTTTAHRHVGDGGALCTIRSAPPGGGAQSVARP